MNRLKQLRESKGLTQSQFGKLFNASQNTVSNWEKGNRKIDNERLILFADYFGVTIEYLLGSESNLTEKRLLQSSAERSQSPPNMTLASSATLTPHQKNLLSAYEALSEDTQKVFCQFLGITHPSDERSKASKA